MNIVNTTTFFLESSEDTQNQFKQAIELGLGEGIQILPKEELANLSVQSITAVFSDSSFNEQSIAFGIPNFEEDLASAIVLIAKSLEWNLISLIGKEFEVFETTLRTEARMNNIYPMNSSSSIIDNGIVSNFSEFDDSKVVLVFGEASFIRETLYNSADFFSQKGLLIATHRCSALVYEALDCNFSCMNTLTGILENAVCVDESTTKVDEFINDVWLPQATTHSTDYRIPMMYDNARWFTKALDAFFSDHPDYNGEEIVSIDEYIRNASYDGIKASNPPAISEFSALRIGKSNKFDRVMDFTIKSFDSKEFRSKLVEMDTAAGRNQDIVLDYTLMDYGNWLLFGFGLLVLVFCALGWLSVKVSMKGTELRRGILTKPDTFVILLTAMCAIGLHIFAILDVFINTCFIMNVLLPCLRGGVLLYMLLCLFDFNAVVLNKSWKILKRSSTFQKLIISMISFTMLVVFIMWTNNAGEYDYADSLFLKSGSHSEMIKVCNADELLKSGFYRWLHFVPIVCVLVLLCVAICYTQRVVFIGKRVKRLQPRLVLLELRIFYLMLLVGGWVLVGFHTLQSSSCKTKKQECSSVGNGIFLLMFPLIGDTIYFFLLVAHAVHQEMSFSDISNAKKRSNFKHREEIVKKFIKRKKLSWFNIFRSDRFKKDKKDDWDRMLSFQDDIYPIDAEIPRRASILLGNKYSAELSKQEPVAAAHLPHGDVMLTERSALKTTESDASSLWNAKIRDLALGRDCLKHINSILTPEQIAQEVKRTEVEILSLLQAFRSMKHQFDSATLKLIHYSSQREVLIVRLRRLRKTNKVFLMKIKPSSENEDDT